MITYDKLFILSGQLYDCDFILFGREISLKISLSPGKDIINRISSKYHNFWARILYIYRDKLYYKSCDVIM